jgi:hypothetical protein
MTELPPTTRRAARRLRLATLAGIGLMELLLLFAAWVLVAGRKADFPALRIADGGLAPWPAALTLLLFGLLLGLALARLARMLGRVEAGAPFAAAGDLRGFAFFLFLAALAGIFAPPLLTLAAQAMAGGVHQLSLDVGGTDLLLLLVSGLLFLVARLLDQAQSLADDHAQIV